MYGCYAYLHRTLKKEKKKKRVGLSKKKRRICLAPGTRTEASSRYKTKTDEGWVATSNSFFYRCLNASHKRVNILTAPLVSKGTLLLFTSTPIGKLNSQLEDLVVVFFFLSPCPNKNRTNRSKSPRIWPPLVVLPRCIISFCPSNLSFRFQEIVFCPPLQAYKTGKARQNEYIVKCLRRKTTVLNFTAWFSYLYLPECVQRRIHLPLVLSTATFNTRATKSMQNLAFTTIPFEWNSVSTCSGSMQQERKKK